MTDTQVNNAPDTSSSDQDQESNPHVSKSWKTANKASLIVSGLNLFFTYVFIIFPIGNIFLLIFSFAFRNYLNKRGWQSAWTVVLVTNLLVLQVAMLASLGLNNVNTGFIIPIVIFLLSYVSLIAFYYLYEPLKGDYQHILNVILVLLVFFFLTREYKIYFPYTPLP
jgi:hypothetical protein